MYNQQTLTFLNDLLRLNNGILKLHVILLLNNLPYCIKTSNIEI